MLKHTFTSLALSNLECYAAEQLEAALEDGLYRTVSWWALVADKAQAGQLQGERGLAAQLNLVEQLRTRRTHGY